MDGVFSWGTNGDMLIFDPSAPMKYNTSHSITISRNAKDSDDNYFASEFQWSFSTQTEPNKDDEKPDDTITASESKSSDDNSIMFSLLTYGVIIIIVLILVILAIFSKLNPKKKTEGEDESTAILAPTQENPQTPTNMQPQQNVYVAGSPVGGMGIPPPATNTVGQTPMPMPMPAVSIAPGTLPSPTMPNQATGPAQVPMLTPAQNTAPTMGGVTYRCPNCTANILDQNNCPYCGWTRM